MIKEIWKDVEGYEGLYQVSNLGRFKSLVREKEYIMRTTLTSNGYCGIIFYKKKKCKRFLIHRVIANAFLDNPKSKSCVNHKDGNKSNNDINNLEWVTHKENSLHASKNGLMLRGEKHPISKLCEDDVNDIRQMYESGMIIQSELSELFNVSRSLINYIIKYTLWNHI